MSDAIAILGVWSQPKKISSYDNTSAKLINIETGTGVIVSEDSVNIVAENLKHNGSPISDGGGGTPEIVDGGSFV